MNIKSILFSCYAALSTLTVVAQNDPVIMQINGKPIYRSEFEYIYNKNNSNNSLDKKTIDEYVDLFVNFKLKVEEAKTQGLDTVASFLNEYNGYRNQLAAPYLIDTVAEQTVLRDAYNRMKTELNVSHILVRLSQNPTPEDTLAAYNKALSIVKRLQKENFEKVARETSEDQSVEKNGGLLGWITPFSTIYAFETAAYNLAPGKISAPVRTQVGYHVIKINDRRPSQGEVHTSHIMKYTKKDDSALSARAKQTIDSLYQCVMKGENFGELAKKYSDDKGSAAKDGELPWFGSGRMVPEFEKAAFALKNTDDISKPIESEFGWHIIKLLGKKPLASYEELKPTIERMVKRDERANVGRTSFIENLRKKYNPSLNKENLNDYSAVLNAATPLDSVFFVKVESYSKPLLSIADKKFTQKDFTNYLKQNKKTTKATASEIIDEKFAQFVDDKLYKYEDSQLENEHSDFRNLTREYHDGILLFDVSNREVWDKASKDTLGLTNFFETHKDDYTWKKNHFKGTVVYCKDKATLNAAKKIIKKAKNTPFEKTLLAELNDSVMHIKVQKSLFVEGDNKEVDKEIYNKKAGYESDKDFPFALVVGKNLKLTPESYVDVRGLVTADYQDYLETEWIKALHNKYKVSIDQNILKTVKKN